MLHVLQHILNVKEVLIFNFPLAMYMIKTRDLKLVWHSVFLYSLIDNGICLKMTGKSGNM
jgi:hypothetical protein